MNEVTELDRLLVGLDASNVKKYGRNKRVAEGTGYSPSMVAKVLSGHVALTDRFIQAVCNAFYIRKEWVYEGIEPIANMGFDADGLEGLSMPPEWHEKQERLREMREDVARKSEKIATVDLEIERLKSQMGAVWEYTQEKYPDLVVAFQQVQPQERRFVLAALEYGFDLLPDQPE